MGQDADLAGAVTAHDLPAVLTARRSVAVVTASRSLAAMDRRTRPAPAATSSTTHPSASAPPTPNWSRPPPTCGPSPPPAGPRCTATTSAPVTAPPMTSGPADTPAPDLRPGPDRVVHREDGGWLVGFVHDDNRNEADLIVLDAAAIDHPPVATVAIPRRIPYGLHGTWIPAT